MIEKDDFEACDVSVHPPFTDLRSVQTVLQADESRIAGCADVHAGCKRGIHRRGVGGMLDKLDVSYVIVGHSERRERCSVRPMWVNAKSHGGHRCV